MCLITKCLYEKPIKHFFLTKGGGSNLLSFCRLEIISLGRYQFCVRAQTRRSVVSRMSSINLLFVFTWIADYFCVCFWCPEGTVIVVAAFYSSELHGELFDVFINLRPACLEAAGWPQDLAAPCLLHLTCAQESSITCPAWGLRWLVVYTTALEKIKLHFPAQGVKREQLTLMHMPLV